TRHRGSGMSVFLLCRRQLPTGASLLTDAQAIACLETLRTRRNGKKCNERQFATVRRGQDTAAARRTGLLPIPDTKPKGDMPVFSAVPRKPVEEWTWGKLIPLLTNGLKNRDFNHGRQMFGAASCFACHRFDSHGGAVGPDLALSPDASVRAIFRSPYRAPANRSVMQYGSVRILTVNGRVVSGPIINLAGDSFRVQTEMLKPAN
ncbi:MAG: hypothetical protein ABGZ53_37315, partial [Fuerstiella sp.]